MTDDHDDHDDPVPATTTAKPGRANRKKFKFTPLALNRLKVPAGQTAFWDTTPGLSLLVSYGGSKAFRASFALAGRYVFVTIGRWPDMDLADARAMAADYQSKARRGIDPRTPEPSATTFGTVVDDFIKLYAVPRQRTWHQTERILKSGCGEWLDVPIANITKKDAYHLLDGFVADGTPYKAAVTLAWCKKLWRWAWEREYVAAPIFDSVKIEFEKRVRDRVYSDSEIKSMWKAADKLDTVTGAYLKLLILTGSRKSALACMRWSDIKDDDTWITPFEHTKSKKTAKPRTYTTPLPPLACRILAGLPHNGDRIFATVPPHPKSHMANLFVKNGAPKDFQFHACRHTLATFLQNAGHAQWEIGAVLNHSEPGGVTANYSHGGPPMKLKLQLLTEWADHVASLVTSEGVVLLR